MQNGKCGVTDLTRAAGVTLGSNTARLWIYEAYIEENVAAAEMMHDYDKTQTVKVSMIEIET